MRKEWLTLLLALLAAGGVSRPAAALRRGQSLAVTLRAASPQRLSGCRLTLVLHDARGKAHPLGRSKSLRLGPNAAREVCFESPLDLEPGTYHLGARLTQDDKVIETARFLGQTIELAPSLSGSGP